MGKPATSTDSMLEKYSLYWCCDLASCYPDNALNLLSVYSSVVIMEKYITDLTGEQPPVLPHASSLVKY